MILQLLLSPWDHCLVEVREQKHRVGSKDAFEVKLNQSRFLQVFSLSLAIYKELHDHENHKIHDTHKAKIG